MRLTGSKGEPMFSKLTKLEGLLEAVPDALVGMDQSGVIRFVNHQTEELFGYDRDDLVGQHIETLVPEALWRIFIEHREQIAGRRGLFLNNGGVLGERENECGH